MKTTSDEDPAIIRRDDTETRAGAEHTISTGGIIAFRTDTFYGLGVDPFNQAALRSLQALKGRDGGKPILLLIDEPSGAERFIAEKSLLYRTLSAEYWPGALTLVAWARPDLHEELTAGTGTIGVRVPADADARALVRACGGALTATSANPAGEPPARTAAEVARYFPEGVELIVDAGEARSTQPSTVLDVRGESARLLREGVITCEDLQRTLRTIGADLIQ